MPNPGLGEEIVKVTLNIYKSDYLLLQKLFPRGWSVEVRDVVRVHCRELRQATEYSPTLGDLFE